jgi:hypothetical protein
VQSASTTETLRRVPLFSGLSEEQLTWISGEGTEVRLAPGQRIASQGNSEPGDTRFQVGLALEPGGGLGQAAQPAQGTRKEVFI